MTMTSRRICSAVAALALLTAPSSAFVSSPAKDVRRGAAKRLPLALAQPVQLRTCSTGFKAARMGIRGDKNGAGKDLPGDGVFGFVGGGPGASKFPVPGDDGRWMSLSRVCVLLFNPRTENEGIYTLQMRVREGYINTVVLFEEQEDAERYAGLLEAQDFPAPQVEALDPREIAAFTADAGYKTSFIPAGTLFLPPEDNVDPGDRPWRPDALPSQEKEKTLAQILADAEDSDLIDYNKERARLESLFGGSV